MAEEHVAHALMAVLRTGKPGGTETPYYRSPGNSSTNRRNGMEISNSGILSHWLGTAIRPAPGMFRNKWLSTWAQRLFCETSVC
jgi:hypothetical protein